MELFSRQLLNVISKDKDDKLVRIYYFICGKFDELGLYCERFSNNYKSGFTIKVNWIKTVDVKNAK